MKFKVRTFCSALIGGALLALSITLPVRAQASLDDQLAAIQHHWAEAYYSVPKDGKRAAFEALETEADGFVAAYPEKAEPLVWRAIVLSSEAKFDGGVGALKMIKKARADLEAAEKIDARALDGSVYTSLGSLYAKAPGWPLAFGNKDKAISYLDKALAINPDGMDPNFFYGELMADSGDKAAARSYYEKALAAPPRPGREDADAGRRQEIEAALAALG